VDVSAGSPTCCVLTCGTDGGTNAKPPVSPSLAALLSLKTQTTGLANQRLARWIDSPGQTTVANLQVNF